MPSMPKYIHLQTKVTREEKREIDIYLVHLGVENKSEWIRKVILKEVRKNVEPEPFFDDSEQDNQSEFFEPEPEIVEPEPDNQSEFVEPEQEIFEPEPDVESVSDDRELPADEAPPKLDLF